MNKGTKKGIDGNHGGVDASGVDLTARRRGEMPLSEAVTRLRRILAPAETNDKDRDRLGSFVGSTVPRESKAGDGKVLDLEGEVPRT